MSRHLLKNSAVALSTMLALGFGASFPTTTGQTTAPPKAKARTAVKTPLDLNRATEEEMVDVLPGVGEVTARKIVAGRPYASVDDLAKAGVPARTIEAIRTHVTVAPPATRPGTIGTPRSPAARVNLNTATAEELQTLPGIGPVHAREIIAARPIRSVDDLERLRGMGKARVDEIRPHVVLHAPAAPAAVATKPAMTRPSPGGAPATAKTARPKAARLAPGQVVNLNTASRSELDELPGIGPVKAQAIIDARPFRTKEDVMKVKGIKEGEFSRIKDLITVD